MEKHSGVISAKNNKMEREKIIKIIEELKGIRTEVKAKVNDEVIWDTAVRIYNAEQIETHRQGNKSYKPDTTSNIFSPSPAPTQKDKESATQNQISALKKMGYLNDTSKLTKYEAWQLIQNKKLWMKKQ